MSRLTQPVAIALATAASQVRADWDHPGILHALRVEADKGTTAQDAFIALANLAAMPEARTPGLLNKPGSWWQKPTGRIERRGDHNVPCPEHPQHETASCPDCRHEAGELTEEQRQSLAAQVRQAIADAPPYVPPAVRAARNQEDQP